MTDSAHQMVSVVLVNFRGADDTIAAVAAVLEQDWPAERLEVVVVDNASGGDDARRIADAHPAVVLVHAGSNLGFAGGCNLGVGSASGDVIAFLNNDAVPEPGWIRTAVQTFSDPAVAAVASRVLDGDGLLVDYIDAGMTWFGKGHKPLVGEVAAPVGTREKDVLFGTGSALFVRRDAYLAAGGFDERYFMFYEDVDLGWRLNLLGNRVRYQPASVVRHRHHGTAGRFGAFREEYLLERNALYTLYKNLGRDRLDEALPAALALTVRRAVAAGGLDSSAFDYRAPGGDDTVEVTVPKTTMAGVYAIDQFVEHLESLTQSRRAIQASRVRSDRDLWSLFGQVDPTPEPGAYADGYQAVTSSFDVTSRPDAVKILVITGDPIGQRMAGPAIRAWHMAEALSQEHDVVLMTMTRLEQRPAPFRLAHIRPGDERGFGALEAWADVIIFQGHAMAAFQTLADSQKLIVADVYDPMHLEQLEQGRELPGIEWDRLVREATEDLNQQLERADLLLCASERQRMLYLGQLAGLGRITPALYEDDPHLERLLAVVPFGIEETPPQHRRDVLKGVTPGIAAGDKVLLWGGGVYSWFDPKSLIRAVAALSERRPDLRLFFQGTKHPHPGVPEMAIVAESRALAQELGVLDRSVFFNDSWVQYDDRQNYLTEADAGVSTHFSHVETTFSFRTRILDYLWAGLPMVVTEGDSFAELVATEDLGVVVRPEDPEALAAAIETVLYDEDAAARFRANVARVRERFFWARTLAPLLDFARSPRPAADRGRERRERAPRARKRGLARDLELVRHHLRAGGPSAVLRRVVARLRSR